jgi:hypothetical protein
MPPRVRAASPPLAHSPAPLHNQLLDPTTTIGIISDNSSYSFILYGERAPEDCIELVGISFNHFCMKITIVDSNKTFYGYTTIDQKTISKYISTEQAINKEVRLQRRLDDNFRKKGRLPLVPYVIHECLLSSIYFGGLFPESKTLQPNVRSVLNSIQHELSSTRARKVHMFFMEYMDAQRYKTLQFRISEWDARLVSQVRTDYKKKAYQRMAAILACAAGCNVIPYDAYEPNVMLDYYANDVRLIDLGNTFDLLSDEDEIVNLFVEMLTRIKNVSGDSLGKFPILDQLKVFFGVTSDSDLNENFKTSLTFVDLQIEGNLTIENIHYNLIMLAFIDFMINRFGLLDMMAMSYCKCRFTMESVYGERSFEQFSNFLTNFRPRSINDTHREELGIIQGIIQGIITPPPAERTPGRGGISCALMGGSKPTFIKRYLPDTLSIRDKIRQRKELMKSRRLYKQRKYYTRKAMRSFKSKPSKHIDRARTLYHVNNIRPSRELSRKTGCSLKGLRQIVKKGEGAYYSSGSRPNQTPQSWGNARLASAITGGNASAVDFHILNEECDHKKPAYRLAQKPSSSHRRPRK